MEQVDEDIDQGAIGTSTEDTELAQAGEALATAEMFDLGGGTTMMMMMTAVMIWKGKKWRKWRQNQKENQPL